jgi:hypothetical protein
MADCRERLAYFEVQYGFLDIWDPETKETVREGVFPMEF